MLQGIERYMKQAIVDKVSGVSSAALCSSLVSVPEENILGGLLLNYIDSCYHEHLFLK